MNLMAIKAQLPVVGLIGDLALREAATIELNGLPHLLRRSLLLTRSVGQSPLVE